MPDWLSIIDTIERSEMTAATRAVWHSFRLHIAPEVKVAGPTYPVESRRILSLYTLRFEIMTSKGRWTQGVLETLQALQNENGAVRGIAMLTGNYQCVCFLNPDLNRVVGFAYFARSEKTDRQQSPISDAT